ncbi:MAG: hypothetical protein JF599_08605 [Verrucomicrobia bacterium]|nr:hypothetical protein [Verrucomicrobiota bacterium]
MTTTSPSLRIRGALLGLLALLCTAAAVRADENYFGYTYGADTLPKGRSEIYQWITSRTGKADGSYSALDLQTEIEHGFTDRLQGSLYLNAISHDISGGSGFSDRNSTNFNGLQGSLKYNLKSADRGGWGVAVYFEPGYKRFAASSGDRTDIYFFEPKVIVQKNYLDDTLVWATNFSSEFEREHDLVSNEWESELELELSTGLSYRFAPGWFAGVEALATSAFEKMHLDEMGEYAIFAGPNLHYAATRWWATLTVLPQLTGWPVNKGDRNLDNYEALQVRLKVGYNF